MANNDQTDQVELIATSIALTSFSAILVLLRCIVRVGLIRKPGWDDLMIVLGVAFTIAYVICLLVVRSNNLGLSPSMVTPASMTAILKSILAIECLYYTTVFGVKASIVFTYLRFAVNGTFSFLCRGTLGLLTVYYIICAGVTIGQCQPVDKAWDVILSGRCLDTGAFFIFTAAFNIVTDLWILILPLPTLMILHIERKDKLVLYGLFGIGAFATSVSCLRLWAIKSLVLDMGPSGRIESVNLWSMIEINSAIVCASIPALRPLCQPRRLFGTMKSRSATVREIVGNVHHEIGPGDDLEITQSEGYMSQVTIIAEENKH